MEQEKKIYDFNGKSFSLTFPSFKKHNKLQKLLKEYGEDAYTEWDKIKELLGYALDGNLENLTEDDITYGQVVGAIQDFFTKSMEMNKK